MICFGDSEIQTVHTSAQPTSAMFLAHIAKQLYSNYKPVAFNRSGALSDVPLHDMAVSVLAATASSRTHKNLNHGLSPELNINADLHAQIVFLTFTDMP